MPANLTEEQARHYAEQMSADLMLAAQEGRDAQRKHVLELVALGKTQHLQGILNVSTYAERNRAWHRRVLAAFAHWAGWPRRALWHIYFLYDRRGGRWWCDHCGQRRKSVRFRPLLSHAAKMLCRPCYLDHQRAFRILRKLEADTKASAFIPPDDGA